MGYHRALIAILILALILLIDLPLHFITWLIGKKAPKKTLAIRYSYVRGGVKIIWAIAGGPVTVIGKENIPTDRPVLFVSNHRSIFDILLAIREISQPTGFIAKKELEKTPLKLIMEEIRCLFLDREDAREGLKSILKAIEYVKEGQSMFIFPEGTRCKEEGVILPFHAGSFKIATKAGCPVVPVTIVNSGDLLEDHFPTLKRVHVIMEFSSPIETKEMDRAAQRELPDAARELIVKNYEKNKALI